MTVDSAAVPGDGHSPRHAVVVGGTGLIGGTLLQLLAADASYHRVTSLVRREGPAPPRIVVQRVDFGRLEVVIVRPSFLVGSRAEGRLGETMALGAAKLIGPLLVGPLRRYAPAEATAVARTLVRSAATAPTGVSVIEAPGIR